MTTRQIRDLAIRILGLYYLAHAIIYLPQILGIYSISGKEAEFIAHKTIFVIASLIPIAMYFVVAYVLLFKAPAIMTMLWPRVDDETGDTSTVLSLTTWVSLIGLFYLVGSVGGFASELWMLGANREMMGSYLSYKFVPNLITLVLAVICIVKAQQIAEYLKKKSK